MVEINWPAENVCIRFLELIQGGVAGIASPGQIRREGKARAEVRRYESILDAQTKKDIDAIQRGEATTTQIPLLARPQERLVLPAPLKGDVKVRREPQLEPMVLSNPSTPNDLVEIADVRSRLDRVERLLNLRAVHRLAEEEAEHYADRVLPEARPSTEWMRAWREGAEKVDEDDLRALWARILCGETVEPGTYSRRMMASLQMLEHREAQALSRVAPMLLANNLPRFDDVSEPVLQFGDLLLLEEAGFLIGAAGHLQFTMESQDGGDGNHIILLSTPSDWCLRISIRKPHKLAFVVYKMSGPALEIIRLGRFQPDLPYLRRFVEWTKNQLPSEIIASEMVRVQSLPGGQQYEVLEVKPL